MDDDYLWDKTGTPDDDVRALERALGGYRFRGAPAAPSRRPRLVAWTLTAAAVAAAVVAGVLLFGPERESPGPKPGWELAVVDAGERVASRRVLGVGEWLETGDEARFVLDVADIGQLSIRPHSRLKLVSTGENEHRVHLARGAVHAVVNAPPRLFVVETPSATAVDLGCEYTLEVDEAGNGLLAVTTGSVALERAGLSITVPYDAVCALRAASGPGTPYFADAPAALRAALERIDTGELADADIDADIDAVLDAARRRDTLSLFHLLPRTTDARRERVYDRMAELVPPPEDVTRAGTLTLDAAMLALWLEELRWVAFDE